MATGTEAKVLDAVLAHLADLDLSPALDIAWPNTSYTPEIGTPFLRVSVLQVPALRTGVSRADAVTYAAVLRCGVFSPRGYGAISATETASQIIAHFPWASRITAGDITVQIGPSHPTLLTPVQEPEWFQVPLDIPFFSII